MSQREPLLIEMGIGWKPVAGQPGRLENAIPCDYVCEIKHLREALKPFALAADLFMHMNDEATPFGTLAFSVGDLRKAKSALPTPSLSSPLGAPDVT